MTYPLLVEWDANFLSRVNLVRIRDDVAIGFEYLHILAGTSVIFLGDSAERVSTHDFVKLRFFFRLFGLRWRCFQIIRNDLLDPFDIAGYQDCLVTNRLIRAVATNRRDAIIEFDREITDPARLDVKVLLDVVGRFGVSIKNLVAYIFNKVKQSHLVLLIDCLISNQTIITGGIIKEASK